MIVTQGSTIVNYTISQGATQGGLNAEIAAREAGDETLNSAKLDKTRFATYAAMIADTPTKDTFIFVLADEVNFNGLPSFYYTDSVTNNRYWFAAILDPNQ